MDKKNKYNAVSECKSFNGVEIKFKSNLELSMAIQLENLVSRGIFYRWNYEPKVFKFNLTTKKRSYKPDFQIFHDETHYFWIECKGYIDMVGIRSFEQFIEEYPDEAYKTFVAKTPFISEILFLKEFLFQQFMRKRTAKLRKNDI